MKVTLPMVSEELSMHYNLRNLRNQREIKKLHPLREISFLRMDVLLAYSALFVSLADSTDFADFRA